MHSQLRRSVLLKESIQVLIYQSYIILTYWPISGNRVAQWLTFWRRNYIFLILAHPVYKM